MKRDFYVWVTKQFKFSRMKKIMIFLLFTGLFSSRAQEKESVFKVDGVDLSLGGYLVEHKFNRDSESSNYGGNITLGITTSFKDNHYCPVKHFRSGISR